MILTEDEIWQIGMQDISLDAPYGYARAIESAVLEKLKAQKPLQPDDVVRDAERLEWLMNSGRMVICDKEGCYTYTHTSGRYGPVAKTQREAIDAAMKEMK